MKNTCDRFLASRTKYNYIRLYGSICLVFLFFIYFVSIFAYSIYLKSYQTVMSMTDNGMYPTIQKQEEIVMTRDFSLDYGDIVAITVYDGQYNNIYVRTIIAFEGDTVQYLASENRLTVKKKDSSQIISLAYDFRGAFNYPGNSVTLKENDVFVLGDNYNNCLDSSDGVSGDFGYSYLPNIAYKAVDKKSVFYDKFH